VRTLGEKQWSTGENLSQQRPTLFKRGCSGMEYRGGEGEVRPRGSMWREREEAGVGHGGFGQLGWSGRGLAEMPMGGVRACIQCTMRSDRAAGGG
jgi:hypothetical protein